MKKKVAYHKFIWILQVLDLMVKQKFQIEIQEMELIKDVQIPFRKFGLKH